MSRNQLRLTAILLKSRSFSYDLARLVKTPDGSKIIIGRKAVSSSTGPPQAFSRLTHTYTLTVTCWMLLLVRFWSTKCFPLNVSINLLCRDASFPSCVKERLDLLSCISWSHWALQWVLQVLLKQHMKWMDCKAVVWTFMALGKWKGSTMPRLTVPTSIFQVLWQSHTRLSLEGQSYSNCVCLK